MKFNNNDAWLHLFRCLSARLALVCNDQYAVTRILEYVQAFLQQTGAILILTNYVT